MGTNPWDVGGPAMIDRLKELHARDRSFGEIARALSQEFHVRVSRNAAIGKATRIGLPKRAMTPAERGARSANKAKTNRKVTRLQSAGVGIVRRARVSVEEFQARLADVVPLHLAFNELQPDSCRYPYGDGPNYTFCGCEKLPGLSYCEPHRRLTRSATLMTAEEFAQHKRTYRAKMIAEAA